MEIHEIFLKFFTFVYVNLAPVSGWIDKIYPELSPELHGTLRNYSRNFLLVEGRPLLSVPELSKALSNRD